MKTENREPFRKLIRADYPRHQFPNPLTEHEVTYLLYLILIVLGFPSRQCRSSNHPAHFVLISLPSLLNKGDVC